MKASEDTDEVQMGQDEIISNTKTVIQGLEALKSENHSLLNGILSTLKSAPSSNDPNALLVNDKATILQKSIESIELGLSEAQVMIALSQHLQNVEAEKHKLRAQCKRLSQENAWLRDELATTQQKLRESEKERVAISGDLEHLKFMDSLRSIDGPNNSSSIDRKDDNDPSIELGFPDEYDVQQGNSDEQISADPVTGSETPQRISTLHNLVIKYAQRGRYEIAVPLARQVLVDIEKTSGHNHPDYATMLNILALVYRDQHMYREAAQLLEQCLEIRERTLGEDDPATGATLNNLAVLFGKRGLFKEARVLCERALRIRERNCGPLHPDVAKQLNNLALICQNLGQYDEVGRLYKRSLEIYEKTLGPNDPIVYKTKNNLASALLKQGEYQKAEELYKQVLTQVHEREYGKIDPDNKPIWQVAEEREEIKSKKNDETTVEDGQTQDDSLTSSIKNLGLNSPNDSQVLQNTVKNLSLLYRRQGKLEAAVTLEDCFSRARGEVRK
ncbi:hypothetical protein GZH46_02884 [Fragariocoptes setiger]|uniref:Kinesin light chain n=1 Tax=Fragariocoptes setiger TaxID=1670756 RepID=A0ABQ7S5B6_9ACAR|nr:hypothetical protein GZH46_02884 [Fragariocoptes setiger]